MQLRAQAGGSPKWSRCRWAGILEKCRDRGFLTPRCWRTTSSQSSRYLALGSRGSPAWSLHKKIEGSDLWPHIDLSYSSHYNYMAGDKRQDLDDNAPERPTSCSQNLRQTFENVKCLKKIIFEAGTITTCPSGWILVNQKCYFFSDEQKTREESRRFCESMGMQLATVKAKDAVLQCHIKTLQSVYWVGLTQRGEQRHQRVIRRWYWSDGSLEPGFPHDQSGYCAIVRQTLEVSLCTNSHQWICEKKLAASDLYERVNTCNKRSIT
ncbi:C-type lectin domain family 10 member A-like [Discoglossus pictus]